MCGICGVINRKKQILWDASDIDAMMDKIRHRGPDDSGVCMLGLDKNIYNVNHTVDVEVPCFGGMGFNRLSIQDVSRNGHQPMVSDDGNVVITFNGEIYNTTELRNRLSANGVTKYRGTSDTEVILRLYGIYGFDKTIKMLNGMFAIAIYDRMINRFFLARDKFGIIPLHIIVNSDYVSWSSEIKAFIALSRFKKNISRRAVESSFLYNYDNETMYENTETFLAGHIAELDVSTGSFSMREYFNFDEYDSLKSNADWKDAEEILKSCVERQLISDVPLGVQLSGGVDSTLAAYYAKEYFDKNQMPIQGYSLSNNESAAHDETKYINHVSGVLRLQTNFVDMTSQKFVKEFESCIYGFERLIPDASAIGIYLVSKLAGKDVKVLISGEGADELCGGYESFAKFATLTKFPFVSIIPQFSGYLSKSENGVTDKFLTMFSKTVSSENVVNFIGSINEQQFVSSRREYWNSLHGTNFEKLRRFYFRFLLVSLLERQNKVCMLNSVENRVPFLDDEFVKLVFSLPEKELMRFSLDINSLLQKTTYQGKDLLKRLSAEKYGAKFAYRKKQAVRVPLRRYLDASEMREYVSDIIIDKMKNRGIVDIGAFKRAYDNLDDWDNTYLCWKAINFEAWCQMFLDGRMPINMA